MSTHEPDSVADSRVEPERIARDARINLRVPTSQAALIRRAAEAQDKSLTDFVVTSASAAAEQVLADRRWFRLEDAAWESFDALLDRPAVFKPRLNELMNSEDRFVD
jgi:uncharacterized protein (DUF1778 family)